MRSTCVATRHCPFATTCAAPSQSLFYIFLPRAPTCHAVLRHCRRPGRHGTVEEVQAVAQAGLDFIRNNVSINSIITGGWRAGVAGSAGLGGAPSTCSADCRLHHRQASRTAVPATPPAHTPCRPRGPAAARGAADAQGGLSPGAHHLPPAPAGKQPGVGHGAGGPGQQACQCLAG